MWLCPVIKRSVQAITITFCIILKILYASGFFGCCRFQRQSCLILVIRMSNSWPFRERACQFHSENYHSVADSVYLGQMYAYILWPEDLDSHFLPPFPAFPQRKTLPWNHT